MGGAGRPPASSTALLLGRPQSCAQRTEAWGGQLLWQPFQEVPELRSSPGWTHGARGSDPAPSRVPLPAWVAEALCTCSRSRPKGSLSPSLDNLDCSSPRRVGAIVFASGPASLGWGGEGRAFWASCVSHSQQATSLLLRSSWVSPRERAKRLGCRRRVGEPLGLLRKRTPRPAPSDTPAGIAAVPLSMCRVRGRPAAPNSQPGNQGGLEPVTRLQPGSRCQLFGLRRRAGAPSGGFSRRVSKLLVTGSDLRGGGAREGGRLLLTLEVLLIKLDAVQSSTHHEFAQSQRSSKSHKSVICCVNEP